MSKGSKQRPGTGYADGWDRIFGQQAKSEAALQAMVDTAQELGLYDMKPGLIQESPRKTFRTVRPEIGDVVIVDYRSNYSIPQSVVDEIKRDVESHAKTLAHCMTNVSNTIERVTSDALTGKITLPQQTCGNCRHWEMSTMNDRHECRNQALGEMLHGDYCERGTLVSPADFGCSLWEAK